MKDSKTVQEETAKMVKQLSGKIDGISDAVLKEMSLQQLKTLADNLQLVTTSTVETRRSNIALEVLNHFLETKQTTFKRVDVLEQIGLRNVSNYFDGEVPETIQAINAYVLIGRLTSKSSKRNNNEQLTAWLKRADAYLKSHLIGKTVNGCLFKDDEVKYYFEEDGKQLKLVEKWGSVLK